MHSYLYTSIVLTLQRESRQFDHLPVRARQGSLQDVLFELQEELVARQLLPQLTGIAGVELDPELELVKAAPWKNGGKR